MRDEGRKALDRVEELPVGTGKIDLTAYLRGTGGVGSFGGMIDYEHRVTRRWSTFGNAWAGATYGDGPLRADYGALGGLRFRF